jgi:hypothetical protein
MKEDGPKGFDIAIERNCSCLRCRILTCIADHGEELTSKGMRPCYRATWDAVVCVLADLAESLPGVELSDPYLKGLDRDIRSRMAHLRAQRTRSFSEPPRQAFMQ